MRCENTLPDNIHYNSGSKIINLPSLEKHAEGNDILNNLFRNSNVFVFIMDNNFRYEKVYNSELLFLDKNIKGLSDYDLFSPEDAKKLFEKKTEVLRTGLMVRYEDNIKIGTKVFYLDMKFEPVVDNNNTVTGISGVVVDTTKKHQEDDKLKKAIKALDRYIKELEQLSYVASHDLQEPLRTIGSFTQLLELRYKGKLDDTADKYIHYTVDGVNRMQSLLNDLLNYTRIPRQSKPFKLCNCNTIVNSAVNSLSSIISEKHAEIHSENLPSIMADENQIMQLFRNLIQNGIKFTRGKIPDIDIKCEQLEFEWLFSVKDNGDGIEKKYHEKIFTIFQRLNDREEFEGTGIGLALCKKIVEHHGGQIWVESSIGKGSTFYFTIPLRGD